MGLQPLAPAGLPIVAASLGAVVALLVGHGNDQAAGDDEPTDLLDARDDETAAKGRRR